MNHRLDAARPGTSEPYSPQRRTALVLTGTGTAGAYHAGVLRALHEAGVKLDIVAGRGIGVVGALFAAVDGAQRLWDDKGFWRSPAVASLYSWRLVPLVAAWALALAVAIVAVPLVTVAVGLIVFPIDFLVRIVGASGAPSLVAAYVDAAQAWFAPTALPTWLPRLVLLVLGVAALVAAIDGWRHRGRRSRGGIWWGVLRPPLSAAAVFDHCWRVMWDLMRGAAQVKPPPVADLGRRYTEMLSENLGQPGFRELLFAVHDVDAHRDLIFALVGESRRRGLIRRSTIDAADARRAEIFDLAGVARDHIADAVAASLSVPLATEWHAVTFSPDAYWRGETHRLGDRAASLIRVIDELIDLGVEQIVLVSATPESPGPHALADVRIDGRGRLGEYVQSAEAAVLRDQWPSRAGRGASKWRPADRTARSAAAAARARARQ